MSGCLQEDCANWDGDGCPCRVLDLEPVDVRADDSEDCQHEWELRSEHDTWECVWCQAECTYPPGPTQGSDGRG